MKILYFTTFDLSKPKGPSINEREFVGELFRNSELDCLAIMPSNGMQLDDFPKDKIRPLKYAWGPSIAGLIFSEIELQKTIQTTLNEFKPDIVVGRLALLPFGCLGWPRISKAPFMIKSLGSAGLVPAGWGRNQIIFRILRPVIKLILRNVVKNASMIDTTTNELRNLLIKNVKVPSNSIVVVPNATNTKRFFPNESFNMRANLNISKETVVIGYTGGNPLFRGGREVVHVVARLQKIGIDAFGLVVGGASTELLLLANQLGIRDKIHAPGQVDYTDMPSWINMIDIGVALDHSTRAAKIGNSYQKIRQFAACGRFIISSQIDAADPVADCPLVVRIENKSIDEIYTSIIDIIELSNEERIARQIAGRTFAEKNLSLHHTLKTRLRLWESIVRKNCMDTQMQKERVIRPA